MTSFQAKVLKIVKKVPRGRVATYGQIARLAGSARAARAVGQLMAHNKDLRNIPCHRIIGSTGALTGYAFNGVSVKRKKLKDEGVLFRGSRVNLKASLWDH